AHPHRADRPAQSRAGRLQRRRAAPPGRRITGARTLGRAVEGPQSAMTDAVSPPVPEPGRIRRGGRMTFSALSVPNYRRYFTGQTISLVGTWMATAAPARVGCVFSNYAAPLP